MTETVNATGASGTRYDLELHPIPTHFNPIAGIYIFLKPAANGNWDALYVGQTSNLHERLYAALQRHQAWACCHTAGATHFAVMAFEGTDAARIGIETDLRHGLEPLCNDQ